MLLQYEILWIDDSQDWYESIQSNIEKIIKGFFFEPKIEYTTDVPDAHFDYTNFDLIIIDFKLKDSHTWVEIINAIRSQSLHTEIIFYSQDSDFHDKLIEYCWSNKYLEWIFTSDRDWFSWKFEKVFETTIKKIENINSLRGLIMAETSELDHKLWKYLKEYENIDSTNKAKIKTIIQSLENQDFKLNINNWDSQDLLFVNKNKTKLSSIWRCKILWELFVSNKKDFDWYYDNIVKKRNDLWHVENSDRISLTLDNGQRIIVSDAKQIRKDILDYKKIFDTILV